jgi:hypothetical protein
MALRLTPTGRALLCARTALGVSTLLAPRLAAKAFFFDPDDNPQLPVMGRMWGIRNLSLVAGMYAATGANRARRLSTRLTSSQSQRNGAAAPSPRRPPA